MFCFVAGSDEQSIPDESRAGALTPFGAPCDPIGICPCGASMSCVVSRCIGVSERSIGEHEIEGPFMIALLARHHIQDGRVPRSALRISRHCGVVRCNHG